MPNCGITDYLREKREAILDRWLQLIMETYPAEGARLFSQNRDRFQNPVRYAFSEGTKALYEELLKGVTPESAASCLDDIVRIRSIQDFSPSEAIAFVFLLKDAIRECLGETYQDPHLSGEIREFESRIDRLALLAFDRYMLCREKIFEIRLSQTKTGGFTPVDRLNLKRGAVATEATSSGEEKKKFMDKRR
jgi:hypothetical protein